MISFAPGPQLNAMKHGLAVLAALTLVADAEQGAPPLCGKLLKARPHIACGVCMEIVQNGQDCSRYDACECMDPWLHLPDWCVRQGYCNPVTSTPLPEEFGLRVTKGHGTRDYEFVRLSLINKSPQSPGMSGGFDYSAQFKFRWTQYYIHTAVKAVTPGIITPFAIGNRTVNIKIPRANDGVTGVLIADPCVRSGSITSLVGCSFGAKFQTRTRLPALLNTFVGSADIDYWGILGDNFYDRDGQTSGEFFSSLTQAVKETPLLTIPGNHDYWILGSPDISSSFDQCGHGHMQFYAQDSDVASLVQPGESATPFNYSVNPSTWDRISCNKASPDNSRFYQQIGNLGIIAQSGAFSFEEYGPFAARACKWLGSAPNVEVGLIVGHWDNAKLGVQPGMDVPAFYDHVKTLPGCDKFHSAGNLKFFMGHTHCNVPHPHGANDTGFMVAGFGMEGCGNYGVPVFDTTEGRNRVYYFDASTDKTSAAVLACVQAKGWRQCLDLAETWLDEPRSVVTQSVEQIV